MNTPAKPDEKRMTMRTLRKWVKAGQTFAMLTCYDATTAKWLWQGGVRTLLVGDTAAQMILGHDTTLNAPMPFMLEITAAVRRGAPGALIMADMPFGSYQCGDDQAMANATAFITQGQADCVKLEVDKSFAPLVQRMCSAGIPVVAHVGSRPQQVRHDGVCHSVGRTPKEAQEIVETARLMLDNGAEMLLIEAVPEEVSKAIVDLGATRQGAPVPIIGCGGGPACHGHVVVLHDLLGLTTWHPPFVAPSDDMGSRITQAGAAWVDRVASGEYLRDDHPYKMKPQGA